MLSGLLPENLLAGVLPTSSGTGATVALILGVLAAGSEYGWGTLKTVLTQRSSRASVLLGKLLAVGVVLVGFVFLAFAAGAAGSFGVASLENLPANWPGFGELVKAVSAAWLILMAWATMGAFLGVLFRGTALAIGLGLLYAFVLEAVITSLPSSNAFVEGAMRVLPGQSSSSLAGSFGSPEQEAGVVVPALPDPDQAVLVLACYVVVFSLLTVLVLRGRDVSV